MSPNRTRRVSPSCTQIVLALSVLAALAACSTSSAQDIQRRLPGFQAPASDSLEAEMLGRLSATGEYLPGDLPRLARLAVLESVSMLLNIRTDLPDSALGNRLDQQIVSLWTSSEAFYDVLTNSPTDAESVAQAQLLLSQVDGAYREVDASLGELPGLSTRAATDFRALSQLLGHVNSAMGILESNVLDQAPPSPEPSLELDALRREAQVVANLLVPLIAKAADGGRGQRERESLVTDLTDFLSRLQGLCRLLAVGPPIAQIQNSFRDARRQMWRAESRLIHLQRRAELEAPWRKSANE